MTIPVTSWLFAAAVAAALALLAAGFVAGRLERHDRRAADDIERRLASDTTVVFAVAPWDDWPVGDDDTDDGPGGARTAVVELDLAARTGVSYLPRQSSTVDVRRVEPSPSRRRPGRGRHARTVGHTVARAVAAGVRTHARTKRPGDRAGHASAGWLPAGGGA